MVRESTPIIESATRSPTGPIIRPYMAIYKDARRPSEISCGVTPRTATNGERAGLPPAAAARALASVPWRSAKRFHAVEHLYHLKLATGTNLHQAMQALRRHPDVRYAEPNFVVEAFSNAPNDPLFTSQWSLQI